MSNRSQRRRAARLKAKRGLPRLRCHEPHKVPYRSLRAMHMAIIRQPGKGLHGYPCGDHYHLTSCP